MAVAKSSGSSDYYQSLRARFAGKPSAAPDARFQMPADPTDHFFGAATAEDEAAAPRLFDPAGVRALADAVATRITQHGKAESTLLAHGLRLAVAAFWLTIAGWFATSAANADTDALAKLFFIIAGAGAGAAILGVLLTLATGKTSAGRTRQQAVLLGQRIALETQSLDHAIGRRVDAVSADAFLKSVDFASASAEGREKFTAYLKRGSVTDGNARAALFLAALLVSVFIAAALGLGADPSVLPLSDYPLALGAVVAGAGLYAGAGLFATLFGRSWRADREAKAESIAFAAARSAFTASDGRAPANLAARLHGRAQSNMADPSLDEKREYESARAQISDWKTRDSAPRFVDTGFQAAPKTFRTDAFEKKYRP